MATTADPKARRQYNWLRLYTVIPRNPKIASLTDEEFRAYIYALCSAREEQIRGEWIDGSYVSAALGPTYAQHVPSLIDKKLLSEDEDGTVRVPQWDWWQTEDPTGAKRQRDYRARQRVTATSRYVTAEEEEEERNRQRGGEGEPPRSAWSAFDEAWRRRGFRPPTKNQRDKILWRILDDAPALLLRLVDEIPANHPDPIGYVKEADQRRRSGPAVDDQSARPTGQPDPAVLRSRHNTGFHVENPDPQCRECQKEASQ